MPGKDGPPAVQSAEQFVGFSGHRESSAHRKLASPSPGQPALTHAGTLQYLTAPTVVQAHRTAAHQAVDHHIVAAEVGRRIGLAEAAELRTVLVVAAGLLVVVHRPVNDIVSRYHVKYNEICVIMVTNVWAAVSALLLLRVW